MSNQISYLMPVRAVEDIIRIKKVGEESVENLDRIVRENSRDVFFPINKPDGCCSFGVECPSKMIFSDEMELGVSTMNFYERSKGDTEEVPPENDVDDNSSLQFEGNPPECVSETEIKSWSSDSDITVLRLKRNYRDVLSQKVDWEDERNLSDEENSVNIDWENHSLINLADTIQAMKYEELTPYTIWSKSEALPVGCDYASGLAGQIVCETIQQNNLFPVLRAENDIKKADISKNLSFDKKDSRILESADIKPSGSNETNKKNTSTFKQLRNFFSSWFTCNKKSAEISENLEK